MISRVSWWLGRRLGVLSERFWGVFRGGIGWEGRKGAGLN